MDSIKEENEKEEFASSEIKHLIGKIRNIVEKFKNSSFKDEMLDNLNEDRKKLKDFH